MILSDLRYITADDIDLDLLEAKLWNIRRFGGHPRALMVRPHTHLVRTLARHDGASAEVVEWCYHHDDHEGVIGDVIGPVESVIRGKTDILDALKTRLDAAICAARGIQTPTLVTKQRVHYYDKLAESLEWKFGLRLDNDGSWPEWCAWLTEDKARRLYRAHASIPAPAFD